MNVLAGVSRITDVVVALVTGLMVLLVTGSVIGRQVFGYILPGGDEAAQLLFVWVCFLGAFLALRRGGHLAITALADKLPPRPHRYLLLAVDLLVGLFAGVVAVSGVELITVAGGSGRLTAGLGISPAWGYLAPTLGASLMALQSIANVIGRFNPGTDPYHGDSSNASEEK